MAEGGRKGSSRSLPRYLRVLIALVLIVGIIYLGKAVLLPLALAILLTFILTPPVRAFQRRGLRRVPAVLSVVTITLLIAAGVGWGVGVQVAHLASDLPTHRDEIQAKLAHLQGNGSSRISRLLDTFRGPPKVAEGTGSQRKDIVIVRQEEPTSFETMSGIASAVLEPAADAGLVLILVVFMLIRREDLRNRFIGLLGHGRLTGATRVLVETAHRLSRFLLMQLSVNAGFGFIIGVVLLLIGVPYWFLWGFLAVVLRFVPYLGTWLAAALPTVLSFATAPGLSQPLLVLASFIVLDLITANAVEPLLFGHSTGVSPLALLVAAVFWTWVWGPIGLVLSTPMTVCLVVLGQHVPRFRFLSMLLGDQPALAPHASYYQRLLAGDIEEAATVARQFATASGLEQVPDDVLIPALRLARRDRERGGLTAQDEEFILDSTEQVLKTLEAAQAAPPDPTVLPSAILLGCPSHHRAEELTIQMMAMVLRESGCRVESATTRILPVDLESRIEREKITLLFISVIPPGGLPQCRYLCRRLRRKFPDLPIVVGYFGKARHFDKLLVKLRAAGASYVNTSIGQTRGQILAMLPKLAAERATTEPMASPAVS
jgi:predicted PurR-regulated permease PerM